MILRPPMAVPSDMARLTNTMSHMGKAPMSEVPYTPSMMASMASERNFWPSCAPWSTATPAPATICAHLKNVEVDARLMRLHTSLMRRTNSQPLPKPRNVEMTRP